MPLTSICSSSHCILHLVRANPCRCRRCSVQNPAICLSYYWPFRSSGSLNYLQFLVVLLLLVAEGRTWSNIAGCREHDAEFPFCMALYCFVCILSCLSLWCTSFPIYKRLTLRRGCRELLVLLLSLKIFFEFFLWKREIGRCHPQPFIKIRGLVIQMYGPSICWEVIQ